MKRVSCYITNIFVREGAVLRTKPGNTASYSIVKDDTAEWMHEFKAELMMPNEHFNFMLCDEVMLTTLTHDVEGDEFYDFNQRINTECLIGITVRQFITANVYKLDKSFAYAGFVLADLEF